MKYLFVLLVSLMLVSCNMTNVNPECDAEIYHNDLEWKLNDCTLAEVYNDQWSFSVQAKGIIHNEFHHEEFLMFTNIPTSVGIFPLEGGVTGEWDASVPVHVDLNAQLEDVYTGVRKLDKSSESYIRIDKFDPQTGIISGSFYTEWLKVEGSGPEHQIIKSDLFEFTFDIEGK